MLLSMDEILTTNKLILEFSVRLYEVEGYHPPISLFCYPLLRDGG